MNFGELNVSQAPQQNYPRHRSFSSLTQPSVQLFGMNFETFIKNASRTDTCQNVLIFSSKWSRKWNFISFTSKYTKIRQFYDFLRRLIFLRTKCLQCVPCLSLSPSNWCHSTHEQAIHGMLSSHIWRPWLSSYLFNETRDHWKNNLKSTIVLPF